MTIIHNPTITWTIVESTKKHECSASGTWKNWEFSIAWNNGGGWNVKINGHQAWTHMRSFQDALWSVKDRMRNWAYIDQFKK